MKLLIFLMLAFPLFATTYYVDADATGSNNGTSLANAWTHIDSIEGNVTSGRVYVYNGSYEIDSISCSNMGTVTSSLEIIAANGQDSVFFTDYDGSEYHLFDGESDGGYLYFKGIKFKKRLGTSAEYVIGYCQKVEFQDCEFDGGTNGRFIRNCEDVILKNSIVTLMVNTIRQNTNLYAYNCSFYNKSTVATDYIQGTGNGTMKLYDCVFINPDGTTDYLLKQGDPDYYFTKTEIQNTYFSEDIDTTNCTVTNSFGITMTGSTAIFTLSDSSKFTYTVGSSAAIIGAGTYGQNQGYLP